jgi:hypothetical protein
MFRAIELKQQQTLNDQLLFTQYSSIAKVLHSMSVLVVLFWLPFLLCVHSIDMIDLVSFNKKQ